MKPFIKPAEVIAHQEHEGNQEVIQELLDKCTALLLDEFDGKRVLVPYNSKQCPQKVLDRVKAHIEASGWKVKFHNGQMDQSSSNTYNMEIIKP